MSAPAGSATLPLPPPPSPPLLFLLLLRHSASPSPKPRRPDLARRQASWRKRSAPPVCGPRRYPALQLHPRSLQPRRARHTGQPRRSPLLHASLPRASPRGHAPSLSPWRGAPTCAAGPWLPAPALPRPRPVASAYAAGTPRFSRSGASAVGPVHPLNGSVPAASLPSSSLWHARWRCSMHTEQRPLRSAPSNTGTGQGGQQNMLTQ